MQERELLKSTHATEVITENCFLTHNVGTLKLRISPNLIWYPRWRDHV